MDKGIFTPMFDTIEEAADMVDAADDAFREGDVGSWRRRYEERRLERCAPERRQNMLLIERLIDEWDDTKMYLYQRLFRLAEPNPLLDMDPRSSVARRLYLKAENAALAASLRVAKFIHRRRGGVDPDLAAEVDAWLDFGEPHESARPPGFRTSPELKTHGLTHVAWAPPSKLETPPSAAGRTVDDEEE